MRTAVNALIALAVVMAAWFLMPHTRGEGPIRVGILHSQTGTMALSEKPVTDATLLAIEEINRKGGLLGRRVEAVLADGGSDSGTFAREAERLITQAKVCTVFGCWTSASRKTVKPVFEAHHHLLIYPVQYEGLESSPNIIYLGAAPNQQILPAVTWAYEHVGKRFFLVGSDYIFPRTANAIIQDHVRALGGAVAGEEYLPLGSTDVDEVVRHIVEAHPDVILNTINGDSNLAFFTALRAAGVTPQRIPTMSFSLAENELQSMDARKMAGDFAAWNYFETLSGAENQQFVAAFRARYGSARVTDDPIEAGYVGVLLWAQAVTTAGSANVDAIRQAMQRQSLNAPEGIVYIDPETLHTWKTVRIGQIQPDGQFNIVWSSSHPIRPEPYPVYRSRADWDRFLTALYRGWGNEWARPEPPPGGTPSSQSSP